MDFPLSHSRLLGSRRSVRLFPERLADRAAAFLQASPRVGGGSDPLAMGDFSGIGSAISSVISKTSFLRRASSRLALRASTKTSRRPFVAPQP